MQIIDINNKKRIIKDVKISLIYPEYVEILFENNHIEWFPLQDFKTKNPEIKL